jgi:hypothetical protein
LADLPKLHHKCPAHDETRIWLSAHVCVEILSSSRGFFVDALSRLAGGISPNSLNNSGLRVRVIEDCLNGRRTVWEGPF